MDKKYPVLLKAFKDENGFVSHQIESFNEFVDYRLQKIIDEIGEIVLESEDISDFRIKFGRVRVGIPSVEESDGSINTSLTPIEAMMRNITYAAPVFLEMIPTINNVEQEPVRVKICDLPIMVKSNRCVLNGKSREELIAMGEDPDNPGGYFIVDGTERVIVMVEEIVSNRPIIEIRSGMETARINSEINGYIQKHVIERKKGIFYISFANAKKIPVVVLLRALGLETDKDIITAITSESDEMEEIYFNIYEFDVQTPQQAKNYIKKLLHFTDESGEKRLSDIIDKYLLPHLGQTRSSRKKKALYIANIVEKLLKVALGKIPPQDLDHYANKRIKLAGDFLEILFRSLFLGRYGLIARIKYTYQKLSKKGKMPSLRSIVESDYLSKRIKSHMATGQWIGGRTGVCQRLERTNYIRTLSHLRNVLSPLSPSQEHFEARALHPTQWGRLCAEETPEGVNIGLRKYLAHLATISKTASKKDIDYVKGIIEKFIDLEEVKGTMVYLNGELLGRTKRPWDLINAFKRERRKGKFDPQITIGYYEDYEQIFINADSGRVLRPLVIVENGKSKLTDDIVAKLESGEWKWNDLLKNGIVEYVDAEEEENLYVALTENDITKEHTHVELHPSVILGAAASLVPFPEYNRGDRVNFGAKMHGQSLGIYTLNFHLRTDTKADVLINPQVPLVKTAITDHVGIYSHPQGQNIVIAIMSYKGYNMEDAIIINKASVERGFARSMFFRTYSTEEKRYWGIERDEIRIPDKSVKGYRTEEAYANLAEDGIINPETPVESEDILIGKVSPLRFFGPAESFMMEAENKRDSSETVREGEKGIVDKVIITKTKDGNKLVKVVVRDLRIPELGDKFATRHGQKGVVGLIVPEEDLPFTSNGIVPDVIVNPHGIPSRLTMGQLLEIIAAKLSALTGREIDATAFTGMKEDEMRKLLRQYGFRDDGKELMYNGETGDVYEARIMIGPIFYQKLHHMVANKIHARARGPVTLLTRQPTEGRAKEGGLRLGEMEKDCLIAHGTALLLHERFSSDITRIPICTECGLPALEDKVKGKVYCPVCKDSKIKYVNMSYAFKLMLDELKSMGIYPKINVSD